MVNLINAAGCDNFQSSLKRFVRTRESSIVQSTVGSSCL